jgi:hypothetical protein
MENSYATGFRNFTGLVVSNSHVECLIDKLCPLNLPRLFIIFQSEKSDCVQNARLDYERGGKLVVARPPGW